MNKAEKRGLFSRKKLRYRHPRAKSKMCLQTVEAVPAPRELREKPEENRQMKQQERYGDILSLLLHGSHFCLFRNFLKLGIAHFFLLNQRQQEGQRHERENTSHTSAAQAHLLVPTEASMH